MLSKKNGLVQANLDVNGHLTSKIDPLFSDIGIYINNKHV